jgi:5-hydroxyisourate hydrolase
MSSISTHVLDTARGAPAAGIRATLEQQKAAEWKPLGEGETNGDGRIAAFVQEGVTLKPGVYRLRFDTGAYQTGFYPEVTVTFRIENPAQHYHVPLLLSPYGYSTYRGS